MLVVQKFGGSSVADAERVMRVAGIITDTYKQGNDVVVVVSAQGDPTDDLIAKAKEIANADSVIVIMSGDFVQRGAPAIMPKHLRTEAALQCGADF